MTSLEEMARMGMFCNKKNGTLTINKLSIRPLRLDVG
jgi:magnesium-transporting ATPase (P-type)